MPAQVVPGSAVVDPTGQWLAFIAHATTATNTNDAMTLCTIELRPGGVLRDVADLGSASRRPAVAPVAWAPGSTNTNSARLAFSAPVAQSAVNQSPGLFDIFGALRPAPTQSGLFVVDLGDTSLTGSQPTRIPRRYRPKPGDGSSRAATRRRGNSVDLACVRIGCPARSSLSCSTAAGPRSWRVSSDCARSSEPTPRWWSAAAGAQATRRHQRWTATSRPTTTSRRT